MGLKPFECLPESGRGLDIRGAKYVNKAIRYGVEKGFEIKSMGLPGTFFDTRGTRDDNNRALKYFDYILKQQGGTPYCEGPSAKLVLVEQCVPLKKLGSGWHANVRASRKSIFARP